MDDEFDSDAEDENVVNSFDAEMHKELSSYMKTVEDEILLSYSEHNCHRDSNDESIAELSNDDLFYDPKSDDADQQWVDDQRRLYTDQKSLNSDAVLNCPACMSLLCLDCQRHEIYKTQYRAMFVLNCKVDTEQCLQYPQKKKGKGRKSDADAAYHPVSCSVCNTEVAVMDQEEVYHFFNVLSGFV